MRSKKEIEEQTNLAVDVTYDDNNPGCFGMTYEDGVVSALDWVLEVTEDKPMDE